MTISANEKMYLQALVDAMGEVRIRYKESSDEMEKKQIRVQYENFSRLYSTIVNELLERDIEFTNEDIEAVKEIGDRISQAATTQELLIIIVELGGKFVI